MLLPTLDALEACLHITGTSRPSILAVLPRFSMFSADWMPLIHSTVQHYAPF